MVKKLLTVLVEAKLSCDKPRPSAPPSDLCNNINIIKNAPIPTGSALAPIGGTQKLVMEAGDLLKVSSSDSASIDCALSVLEVS